MALAAAVMKAVNSSLYGLRGRVRTVHQALTYLGMRRWQPSPSRWACAPLSRRRRVGTVWGRAAKRGLLMGRMGQMLGIDPGQPTRPACSRNAARRCSTAMHPSTTRPCCAPLRDDAELVELERTAFGVSHDAWAPRCASWGLARRPWPASSTTSRCRPQ